MKSPWCDRSGLDQGSVKTGSPDAWSLGHHDWKQFFLLKVNSSHSSSWGKFDHLNLIIFHWPGIPSYPQRLHHTQKIWVMNFMAGRINGFFSKTSYRVKCLSSFSGCTWLQRWMWLNQLIFICWFELVVWDSRGTPKVANPFHFRGFQESKPPTKKKLKKPESPSVFHHLWTGKLYPRRWRNSYFTKKNESGVSIKTHHKKKRCVQSFYC